MADVLEQPTRWRIPEESDVAGTLITKSGNSDPVEKGGVIYVGTGGDIKVTSISGDIVTFKNFPSGQYLIGSWIQIYDTLTTASDLLFGHDEL